MATTPTPSALAASFLAEAKNLGFRVERKTHSSDAVVTVETTFAPGDRDAYVAAEADAYRLLRLVPTVTYGSTWGTDSGSVGGHAGLSGGYMRLSKSGVSKRFASAVSKAL